MAEVGRGGALSTQSNRKEDHTALVRAAHSIIALRALFDASKPGEEGEHLARINVVSTLRTDLLSPSEQRLRSRAQQIVREFSLSSLTPPASDSKPPSNTTTSSQSSSTSAQPSTQTYAQTTETKARTTSACTALYLLSPPPATSLTHSSAGPALLLAALHAYLQAALTSSLAALARALASLPTLTRALAEVSARCHNIAGLETLLGSIAPPDAPSSSSNGPSTSTAPPDTDLLAPLLRSLDTHSLPSYFWRSLASGLGARVQEILLKGGVPARNLRAQRDRVREAVREAVLKGCEGAVVRDEDGREIKGRRGGEWEREVMVVVGSVVGGLGR